MKILCPIIRVARTALGRLALTDGSRQLTCGELDRLSGSAAAFLVSLGLRRGERVALSARNTIDWIVTAHACARCGAILVPVNARSGVAERERLMTTLTPAILLTDDGDQDVWGGIAASSLRHQLSLTEAAHGWSTVAPGAGAAFESIDLEAVNAVIATSGSTGQAKYVCLTNRNWYFSALASAMHLGHRADDRWLINLPLCHVGGLSIAHRAAVSGFAVHVQAGFDAAKTMEAITEHGVTHLSLVPTTLQRLLDHAGGQQFPGHVRAALIGGGPASTALLKRARACGLPVLPTYGLTEASSQVATLPPGENLGDTDIAARPLPMLDVAIRDGDGADVHRGETGTIWIRGPMVAREYWTDTGRVPAQDADGRLATNDVGFVDAAGHLHVIGRRDDVIVSGGENVSLLEIERALSEVPGVAQAAVIAIDDSEWGQAPVAFVAGDSSAQLDAGHLRAALRGRLAGYKLPTDIVILDELPVTAIGKVDRGALHGFLNHRPD